MKCRTRAESLLRSTVVSVLAVAILTLVTAPARASLVDDINQLRLKGCGKSAAAPVALRSSRELDAVAREWARGGRLRDALDRTTYHAINSASMRIEGTSNDTLILRMLAQNYCDSITGRDFTEIGLYRRDADVWIVVAAPFSPPSVKDAERIAAESLALVNQARAQPRRCGSTSFPAAGPLKLSALLNRAALIQAQDMAAHRNFEHVGTDGSTPAQRITRVGYRWRSAAENIATGPTTAQQVIDGWLNSPGHCANIMSANSTEMGIAFAVDPRAQGDIYWSQEFASPAK
jgi:uncharacterized protein YkwD